MVEGEELGVVAIEATRNIIPVCIIKTWLYRQSDTVCPSGRYKLRLLQSTTRLDLCH